jgi:hypothetical protein
MCFAGVKMKLLGRVALIAAIVACLSPAPAFAEPTPPQEGCRPASKLEYDSAKREYLLISRFGRYVRTGNFWRHYYWWCHL